MNGFIFTFEGGEGCGKSTQVKLLAQRLIADGYPVSKLKFYEPGGTDLADMIRAVLKRNLDTDWAQTHLVPLHPSIAKFKIDTLTQALLFFTARYHQFLHKVAPDVEAGNIIILDRSVDSTTVYQGHVQQPHLIDWIRATNELCLSNAGIKINKTFYLDIDPKKAFERIAKRNNLSEDFFDSLPMEFHEKVREGYLAEAKVTPRMNVIDATGSVAEVHERIYNAVKEILDAK